MTFPPIDSTSMDKATLQRVIADMLKELRDQAIGIHKDITCYIRWKFREIHDSAYSFDYYPITRNFKDNGGLPSKWDDSALENLYRGLTDGRVQAVALDEQEKVLGESSVRETAARSTSKRTRLPHKLRDRLIDAIETAIGRRLDSRAAKTIDPRKSDPFPPNLYKWQFSENYPAFPDKKGGISRWHADQIHACYEALDRNYLCVVDVQLGSSEAINSPELDLGSAGASEYDRSSVTGVAETPFNIGLPSSNRPTVDRNSVRSMTRETQDRPDSVSIPVVAVSESSQASIAKSPLKGLDDLQTQMFDMLSTALKGQAEELETAWKARQVSEQTELREARVDVEKRLQAEGAAHRKTLNNLLASRQEGEKLRGKLAQLERDVETKEAISKTGDERFRAKIAQLQRDLDEKVSLARTEGRQSMSDEILKDLDRTMESERLALRRNHVEQLVKVRAESYELGFQAGRKETASSEAGRPKPSQVIADLESLREQHKQELESARKAGRESAYSELSLGPDERVNFMLQHNGDLNSNRKIRELKTIHQNWNDIPQRVLPSYMLPEGHTPGDKTLYLLARLSKDVDGPAASQLLTEEIDKRCKHSLDQAKCRIVTNTDIRNVLDRINPSSLNELASRGSVDISETPQPLSQDQNSAVPRSQNPDRARSGPQPKILSKDSASKQQKESTDKEVAEIMQANRSPTFAIAVEKWLDVDFKPSLWYPSSDPDNRLHGAQAAQISTATGSRTLAEEFRSHNPSGMLLGRRFETIAEGVSSAAKLAGMLGKTYSTALELRTLKRYLADLTRNLVGDHLYKSPGILHAFQSIHSIFNHYNDLYLASKAKEASQAITVAENIPSRNIVTTSNRPVLGKVCNAPKRSTTDFNTRTSRDAKRRRTASAVPPRAREIHRSAENRNPSVEISGSTVVVESRARKRELPVFKKDEDEDDEDLYGASPPPRVRKRVTSKQGMEG